MSESETTSEERNAAFYHKGWNDAMEAAAKLHEDFILQYNSHGEQRTVVPLRGRPLCETSKTWAAAIRALKDGLNV